MLPTDGWEPPAQPLGPTSTIFKRAHEKRATLSHRPGPGRPACRGGSPLVSPGPGCREAEVSLKWGWDRSSLRRGPHLLSSHWSEPWTAGHVSMKRRPLGGEAQERV